MTILDTYKPGIYEAQVLVVNLRKEPRTIDYKVGGVFITNKVGQITIGTQRELHSFVRHNDQVWGRVSQPDAHGTAIWCCVSTTNTPNMMLYIRPSSAESAPVEQLSIEARLARLEAEVFGK